MSLSFSQMLRRDGFVLHAEAKLPGSGITGVLGPSGAGKSTLLRCLCGLERTEGFMRLGDSYLQDDKAFLPPEKRRIGYVPQDSGLLPHLTVQGNLEYARRRSGNLKPAAPLIEQLGLHPLLQRRSADLSGGERRRVAIARALLSAPRMLLLDEPLTGLHGAARDEIADLLLRTLDAIEVPVLWVSHDLAELARGADYLLSMRDGVIVRCGTLNEVLCSSDNPFGSSAGAVLETRVSHCDNQLTVLQSGELQLRLPGIRHAVGTALRLLIPADTVSITLSPAHDSSILNIIPARVESLGNVCDGQRLVRLQTDAGPLLARLSGHSVGKLGLAPGMEVHAQIKGASLVRVNRSAPSETAPPRKA